MNNQKKLNDMAVNYMTNPVLVFDSLDLLQVRNRAAASLLSVRTGMRLADFIQQSDLRYILTPERRKLGKTKEFTLTVAIEDKEYLIHGQELRDNKGHYIGLLMLYNDISGHERLKDEATRYATRDPLTGLWNRAFFIEMVEKTLRENPNEEFMMIASEIHQFKVFNDVLGKKTGDEVLVSIANMFREKNSSQWVQARISGDSFAFLIPKKDYHEAHFLAYMHSTLNQQRYALKPHIYFGVYEINDRTLSVESMYDRSCMALESIREDLQKQIAYYDESLRVCRLNETYMLDELESALRNEQIVIYFQPVIDIRKEKVVGCEALVRWKHPKRGLLIPKDFVPLFEKNGLIARLDHYVWNLACKKLAEWNHAGFVNRSISVNISAKDFFLSDLYEDIVGLVNRYGIRPQQLWLEITESALALDIEKQLEIVKKLQDYGFVVGMDDFGSGYSSLNSLKDIEVDIMKLDMKFFEKIKNEKRAELIVESVIELAHKLHMPVIAEGVETREQMDMLERMQCQMVQGFYYSEPIPDTEIEAFLEKYPTIDLDELMNEVMK